MAPYSDSSFFGMVIELHARSCHVAPDEGSEAVLCVLSGKLYEDLGMETKPVVVGDRVRVDSDGKNLTVEQVLPRRNCLRRPAPKRAGSYQVIAANVDRMLVVASYRSPRLKPGLIDRFLVAAGIEDIDGVVCINKIDLARSEEEKAELETIRSIYADAGYSVAPTCAMDGRGVDLLQTLVRDGVTLIVGHSGVGKSSLLNAMDPSFSIRTKKVSSKWNKGRHTTTLVRLFSVVGVGFFIDTPGIREFGISSIEPHHLGHYYPEIAAVTGRCRFPDCSHRQEPDCAVREEMEAGRISRIRYESYLRIRDSLS